MTTPLWTTSNSRVEEIFYEALQHSTAQERNVYLEEACAGDAAIEARVRRLLAAHDEVDNGFLAADLSERAEQAADAAAKIDPALAEKFAFLKSEEAGERIGNYELLQELGQGGFGTVWMAAQLEPVRRHVALKIIRVGMDTRDAIVRFEQECQALAIMDHPNIAKVLDAGTTPTGRPFSVMELVQGVPLTEYCDTNILSMAERLKLFVQVCSAVQHAHQKGIIHRDLKPSNILVTLQDGEPVPKVIDFGIAKATREKLTKNTFVTHFECMIGTPLYMSPEQAEMNSRDIDTRSDIYSLGVLLYELLTGKTPFDPEELKLRGLEEIRRVIREEEPPKPSTALSSVARDTLTSIAKRRRTEPPKLISTLKGDLDWIVMRALEKDRSRRYETADGLAQDVLRHMNSEPVLARPPSQLYRFRRMVKRNRLAVSAAAAVVVALIAGAVVSTWQASRAIRAEADTKAFGDFLVNRVLASHDHRTLTEDLAPM